MSCRGAPSGSDARVEANGLATITPEEADALENYVLLHRLHGSAWWDREPWAYRREMTRSRPEGDLLVEHRDEAAEMDVLRRRMADRIMPLVDLFRTRPASEPPSVREIVVALFKLYDEFGVRATITQWMADAEKANEIEQRCHTGWHFA